MDAQLQKIIELQTEQNQLLKKYLWRFRFSLLTLLLLTTGLCCGLGFVMYKVNSAFQIFPTGVTYYGIPPGGMPPIQQYPPGMANSPYATVPPVQPSGGSIDPAESAPASK